MPALTPSALTRTRHVLDAEGVDAVMAAGERTARDKGYRVVIVVVDASGRTLALRRTPDAQAASDQVAIDKARTAAIFVRPSREIEEQVSAGRFGALALHGARALIGGIPLTIDGEVVGAIGTSGETTDEDEAVSIAGAAAEFTTIEAPALRYAGARLVAEAANGVASARGVAPVVTVVDAGGDLMYLARPDAAQVASVGVSTDKARTAAIYRRPSKDFEDQAAGGRRSALHLAGAVALQGGMPLEIDGRVVGAVGVSGASSAEEDQELAILAQQSLGAALAAEQAADAVLFPSQAVREKFKTGGLLLDEPGYKVDAGRREHPGEVEYHERVADIMHVVEGRATVVTGGASRAVWRQASCGLGRSTAGPLTSSRRATSSSSQPGAASVRRRVRPVPLLRRKGRGLTWTGAFPDPRSCCPGVLKPSSTCRPTRVPHSWAPSGATATPSRGDRLRRGGSRQLMSARTSRRSRGRSAAVRIWLPARICTVR